MLTIVPSPDPSLASSPSSTTVVDVGTADDEDDDDDDDDEMATSSRRCCLAWADAPADMASPRPARRSPRLPHIEHH
jgi:hypothetical protein